MRQHYKKCMVLWYVDMVTEPICRDPREKCQYETIIIASSSFFNLLVLTDLVENNINMQLLDC